MQGRTARCMPGIQLPLLRLAPWFHDYLLHNRRRGVFRGIVVGITFRNYEGPQDLHRQQEFWVEATRQLPWCWKPTASPTLYSKGKQFDPRSRVFAFDNGRLIGYCSFTGQEEFVSLGYPWVLPGFEGGVQERLFDSVYGFAASKEYGGRVFA